MNNVENKKCLNNQIKKDGNEKHIVRIPAEKPAEKHYSNGCWGADGGYC